MVAERYLDYGIGLSKAFFKYYYFFYLALLVVILILLSVIGGLVFKVVEAPPEEKTSDAILRQRDSTLRQLRTKIQAQETKSEVTLFIQLYEGQYIGAIRNGTVVVNGIAEPLWTFGGSVYYCITTFSLVGYGNLAPRTNLGRAIALIYCGFTIPVTSLILGELGEILLLCFDYIWMFIFARFRRNADNYESLDMDESNSNHNALTKQEMTSPHSEEKQSEVCHKKFQDHCCLTGRDECLFARTAYGHTKEGYYNRSMKSASHGEYRSDVTTCLRHRKNTLAGITDTHKCSDSVLNNDCFGLGFSKDVKDTIGSHTTGQPINECNSKEYCKIRRIVGRLYINEHRLPDVVCTRDSLCCISDPEHSKIKLNILFQGDSFTQIGLWEDQRLKINLHLSRYRDITCLPRHVVYQLNTGSCLEDTMPKLEVDLFFLSPNYEEQIMSGFALECDYIIRHDSRRAVKSPVCFGQIVRIHAARISSHAARKLPRDARMSYHAARTSTEAVSTSPHAAQLIAVQTYRTTDHVLDKNLLSKPMFVGKQVKKLNQKSQVCASFNKHTDQVVSAQAKCTSTESRWFMSLNVYRPKRRDRYTTTITSSKLRYDKQRTCSKTAHTENALPYEYKKQPNSHKSVVLQKLTKIPEGNKSSLSGSSHSSFVVLKTVLRMVMERKVAKPSQTAVFWLGTPFKYMYIGRRLAECIRKQRKKLNYVSDSQHSQPKTNLTTSKRRVGTIKDRNNNVPDSDDEDDEENEGDIMQEGNDNEPNIGLAEYVLLSLVASTIFLGIGSQFLAHPSLGLGMSYFDCYWFIYISITTIGYGDIVPTDQKLFVYILVYIFLGLCLMSNLIGETSAFFSQNVSKSKSIASDAVAIINTRKQLILVQRRIEKANYHWSLLRERVLHKKIPHHLIEESNKYKATLLMEERELVRWAYKIYFKQDPRYYSVAPQVVTEPSPVSTPVILKYEEEEEAAAAEPRPSAQPPKVSWLNRLKNSIGRGAQRVGNVFGKSTKNPDTAQSSLVN